MTRHPLTAAALLLAALLPLVSVVGPMVRDAASDLNKATTTEGQG